MTGSSDIKRILLQVPDALFGRKIHILFDLYTLIKVFLAVCCLKLFLDCHKDYTILYDGEYTRLYNKLAGNTSGVAANNLKGRIKLWKCMITVGRQVNSP